MAIDLTALSAELDEINEHVKITNSPSTIEVVTRLTKIIRSIAVNLYDAQSTMDAWSEEAGEEEDE